MKVVRNTNPWARILLGAVLLGIAIYYVQQQRRAERPQPHARPIPAGSPSAEGLSRFVWVPRYPGAELEGIHTQQTAGSVSYGFQFEVKGDFQPVLAFYERELQSAGFKLERKNAGEYGSGLHGDDPTSRRTIDIRAGKLRESSVVEVSATERLGG